MRAIFCFLFAGLAFAGGVRVEFNPTDPAVGPFPTDFLTAPNPEMKTGRQVALPLPDSSQPPEAALLNQLDGFNVQARITVKFSGPVNPDTLKDGLFFLWLDPVPERESTLAPTGTLTRANRIVFDPATNTAYAKPDDVLEQGRRYAILVTTAVKDLEGAPVEADEGFRLCLQAAIGGEYCEDVSRAAALAAEVLEGAAVAGGAVFTTATGTAFLEKVRDSLDLTPPSFQSRGVHAMAEIGGIVFLNQTKAEGALEEARLPAPVSLLTQAGVARLAFGSYLSPSYLNAGGFIDAYPTALDLPPPQGVEEIHFHALLPASGKPSSGYPVVIAGHGIGDSRFGIPSLAAYNFASSGYAVIAINAVGHGYGAASRIRLEKASGNVEFAIPGRGRDLDGDGAIGESEGCVLLTSSAPFALRDCLRQTAIDLMQLVRAIRAGMDLDGDGAPDLDPSRISYLGQSLGSFYGSLFMALEPSVLSATLNVGGGTTVETARKSPTWRPLIRGWLAARAPGLLDEEGNFDEEYTGRDEPVHILSKPSALMLQNLFEQLEWLESSGAPVTYAPHFRRAPLPGVPAKRVLFQIALGDQTVPNPSSSLLIRAAGGREMTSLYRHDLARDRFRGLPENPHAFLAWFNILTGLPIYQAGWQQALLFLAGDGDAVPDVNSIVRPLYGQDLFLVPGKLPEALGFQ
jgi:dienelactone hydrolase